MIFDNLFKAKNHSAAALVPDARCRIERMLVDNIVPFWYPGCIDLAHGGFRLNHDAKGQWDGPAPKYLVTQSRMIWFFARLSRTTFGVHDHLAAAFHGFRFLMERMHDPVSGGYAWKADDEEGTDQDRAGNKHIYGQSFALYALSELAMASKDPEPEAAARALFDTVDRYAYDRSHGGYKEFFERDWSAAKSCQPPFPGQYPSTIKTLDSHLHLLEALSSYVRLTGDDGARARLAELILILTGPFYLDQHRAFANACTESWHPTMDHGFDACSYGHNLETVWLLEEGLETLGISPHTLDVKLAGILDQVIRSGFDKKRGGVYFRGPFGRRATKKSKVFWVQAEALLCFLRSFQRTGDPAYALAFNKTLAWIEDFQTDWQFGEWHDTVKSRGRIIGQKAGPSKAAYHNGRALIECYERLAASGI